LKRCAEIIVGHQTDIEVFYTGESARQFTTDRSRDIPEILPVGVIWMLVRQLCAEAFDRATRPSGAGGKLEGQFDERRRLFSVLGEELLCTFQIGLVGTLLGVGQALFLRGASSLRFSRLAL
jgi:hypothetical protein